MMRHSGSLLGRFSRLTSSSPALRLCPLRGAWAAYASKAKKEAPKEEHDEDEEEETVTTGVRKKKTDFHQFRVKDHIQFLAMPHWNTPDPEFLRIYYVLYFLMAFLMRARRNQRYARFLRMLRTERVAIAEAMPGHVGVGRLGQELLRLNQQKYAAIANTMRTQLLQNDPSLGQLREVLKKQAGDPEAAGQAYRTLYQSLAITLHNYDAVRHLDQWRPGRQGLLVPARVRPPIQREPEETPPPEATLPFLFKKKHVVMYEAEATEDDGEAVPGLARVGPVTKHRVLGTLPNVMPRRQLAAYYRLYRDCKKEGTLPPHLRDDPYRAMRGFCRHWVAWTLTRQREIADGQRLTHAGTTQLASRMVRFHQGLGASKLLAGALGVQKAGDMQRGIFAYRDNLLKFYETVLVKYTGYSDDVRRMVSEIGQAGPPTPMELFDSIWRSVFLSKEGIFSWRMNLLRRKYVRAMAARKNAQPHPARTAAVKRNESRYLRHYYLIKTILSMSMVGQPPRPHPSQQLALVREKVLGLLYEMLLPTARLAYHTEREAEHLQWDGVMQRAGQRYRPLAAAAPAGPPTIPLGEIVSSRALVNRYPIHGNSSAQYLKQLQAYRRNHLLRTVSLALNVTPRGHQGSATASQG
eukprot:EG_transcript_5580